MLCNIHVCGDVTDSAALHRNRIELSIQTKSNTLFKLGKLCSAPCLRSPRQILAVRAIRTETELPVLNKAMALNSHGNVLEAVHQLW
jgi:hypothetical protein